MPSLSVTLTAEEYAAVAKVAKKEKKSENRVVAECVRVILNSEKP